MVTFLVEAVNGASGEEKEDWKESCRVSVVLSSLVSGRLGGEVYG